MLTAFLAIALVQRLTKMAAFDTAVPTVDISPFTAPAQHSDAARRAVGQEWDAAMTNVGFAMLVGHGVEPAIVDALRRGGEPARDGESMLLPPVDREGMRRKAGSAVECELRLLGGGCRKLCIVRRRRERSRGSGPSASVGYKRI